MRTGGIAIALLLATSGCATTGVTMFDGGKEKTGTVAVLDPKTGADLALLNQANGRTGISNGKPGKMKMLSDADVSRRYGELIAEVPEQPKLFTLYFREGSTDLVDESNALVPELFQEMKRRPGADVQIVGHTDTVGEAVSNDDLSVKRAQQVEALLIAMGMPKEIVRATGRGERELIEPTEDNVASLFNRRVEVYIK